MSRFLAYTAPAVGHVLPVVPGLLELRARGHEVHVRTLPSLVPTLAGAGLDVSPIADAVTAIEVSDFAATTDADRLKRGQVDLIARGYFDGPDFDDAVAMFNPDVVLVDANAYGAQVRAEASGIPRAILAPSVVPVPGRGIPPYGLGLKPRTGPLGRVRDAVLWRLVERTFGRAILPGLNKLRAASGLAPYSTPLDIVGKVDALIAMTAAPLEYPRWDPPGNIHFVGVNPWDVPSDRPAFLDEPGDPWVLVTCSTDYQGDEKLADIAAQAFADQSVRVLITIGDAMRPPAGPLPANVRVERFVPHNHVLPDCAAVVCHGGMGITSKAMLRGVPVVVVPFGRDQPEIARRVTEAGAGVSVKPKRLTPAKLRDALSSAMAMKNGAARAGATLAANSSPAMFADVAETLVRNDCCAPAGTV